MKFTVNKLMFLVLILFSQNLFAQDNLRIGVANLLNAGDYFTGMDLAVHEAAKKYNNVEVVSTDAGFDPIKLAEDIEDLLARGVDGLIISAGPTESLPTAIDAINDAGIPVVFVDRLWSDLRLDVPWNWVGAQNSYMGEQLGSYLRDRLSGSGTIVVLRGGPADNSIGLARTNGMLTALEGAAIEIEVAEDFTNWGFDGGYSAMNKILAQFNSVDAVFCESDAPCLGAQQAVLEAGRSDEMFFVASDASKATLLEMMNEGSNFEATALNDSDQIGRVGFEHLIQLINGESIDQLTPLDSPMILQGDAKEYYDPNKVF